MKKNACLFIFSISFFLANGQTNTWTGAASTDWHSGCNWSLYRIPACTDNVVIPNGTPNNPTISGVASCLTIDIQGVASTLLTINTGALLQVDLCPTAATYNPACATSNTWCRKIDFGGVARFGAVGFSIGTKGYIGTGSTALLTDFWEWDQLTNVWTQKANFGGTGRYHATGFSIGTKGYIGTGYDVTTAFVKDFWEWDQSTNVWTRKADFGGVARRSATGFSIGTKGYIGMGIDATASPYRKDFWEYNPATDTWTAKANFGGTGRESPVGFSIGTKGYIGTGNDPTFTFPVDFWEYNPATDTWTAKANFGGVGRYGGTGFSIGTKGYIGTGLYFNGAAWVRQIDFWEYDQGTNVWTQKANFGGTSRYFPVGFSIGTKGYIGTGVDPAAKKDFWEYCQ